jgi:hypothetical protein
VRTLVASTRTRDYVRTDVEYFIIIIFKIFSHICADGEIF